MRKIISFSLWGNNRKYLNGAIENCKLAQTIYPDWISYYYLDSIAEEILPELLKFDNVKIINMNKAGDWSGMFWRFYAGLETQNDVVIFRDCDSRLSTREKFAVDEWLASDKDFHIMRDHPFHNTAILGGMWGARNQILDRIGITLQDFPSGDYWQVDQTFLRERVYGKILDTCFIHDSYGSTESFSKKFPTDMEDRHFVGEIFDENNKRFDHYSLL